MIQRFVDAGITFEEEGEVELALSILPTINNYRISVYRLFMDEDKSFTRLNQLHDFDTKLRELVSKMLPAIENGIKASLAYAVTKKYKELNSELIDSEEKYEALAYMEHSIYKKDVKSEKINIMLSGFADLLTSKQEKDPVMY